MPTDNVHYRTATEPDALCLSVLATHVFLDTYATEGIRPARSESMGGSVYLFEGDRYETRVFVKKLLEPKL